MPEELKRGYPTEFATVRQMVTATIMHARPSRPSRAASKPKDGDRIARIDIKGGLAALCGTRARLAGGRRGRSGELVSGSIAW